MRLVLLPLIALIAVPAVAQETRASAAAKFDKEFTASDTDRDGVLTRDEVQARIAKMAVGKRQLDATHAKRVTDLWFDNADANKNGKVTKAEAQALLAKTFAKYDANGDGQVGTDERAAAVAGMKKGR